MKAIKINAHVPLTYGIVIPPGAVAIVQKCQVLQPKDGLVPLQISASIYASEIQMKAGMSAIDPAAFVNFNPSNYVVRVSKDDYATMPAEGFFLSVLFTQLNKDFPGNCEYVSLTDGLYDVQIPSNDEQGTNKPASIVQKIMSMLTPKQVQ
jgi:hypothetical protein